MVMHSKTSAPAEILHVISPKEIFTMLVEIAIRNKKTICQIHSGITKRKAAVCGPRPLAAH